MNGATTEPSAKTKIPPIITNARTRGSIHNFCFFTKNFIISFMVSIFLLKTVGGIQEQDFLSFLHRLNQTLNGYVLS